MIFPRYLVILYTCSTDSFMGGNRAFQTDLVPLCPTSHSNVQDAIRTCGFRTRGQPIMLVFRSPLIRQERSICMTIEFQTLVEQVANRGVLVLSLGKTVDAQDLLARRYEAVQRWTKNGLLPEKGWNSPLGIQFEITHKCNLECVHCYNNSSAGHSGSDLTNEEWLGVAHQATQMQVLNAVISGGEPLIREQAMFGVMDTLHAVGTRFLLITNG